MVKEKEELRARFEASCREKVRVSSIGRNAYGKQALSLLTTQLFPLVEGRFIMARLLEVR